MGTSGILLCLDLRNQERGMLQKLLYLQGVMFASGFLLPSIAPVAAILVQHYGGFEMSVPKVIYILYSTFWTPGLPNGVHSNRPCPSVC